jgi:hypothetical protein
VRQVTSEIHLATSHQSPATALRVAKSRTICLGVIHGPERTSKTRILETRFGEFIQIQTEPLLISPIVDNPCGGC